MLNESITPVDRHTYVIDEVNHLISHLKRKNLPQRVVFDSNENWYLVSSNEQLPHTFIVEQVYDNGFYDDIDIIDYIENGSNRVKGTNNQIPNYLYYLLYTPEENIYKNFFDGIDHAYSFKNFGTIYTKGFQLFDEIKNKLDLQDLRESTANKTGAAGGHGQPTNSSRQQSDSVIISGLDPNTIIQYVNSKIKMSEIKHKERLTMKQLLYKLRESFNDKSTGMSYYDDVISDKYYAETKQRFTKVIEISPKKYIEACVEGFNANKKISGYEGQETTFDGLVSSRTDDSLEELKQKLQTNEIDMPVLEYQIKNADYIGFTQEGIHRAIAAMQLGYEKIPVLVCISRDYKADADVDNTSLKQDLEFFSKRLQENYEEDNMNIPQLLEKLRKTVLEPQEKVFFDDMEDETGLNQVEECMAGPVTPSIGPSPTPAMGQTSVNGKPVEGKSVKKKKVEEAKNTIGQSLGNIMQQAADEHNKEYNNAKELYQDIKNLSKQELVSMLPTPFGQDDIDFYMSKDEKYLIKAVLKNKFGTAGEDFIRFGVKEAYAGEIYKVIKYFIDREGEIHNDVLFEGAEEECNNYVNKNKLKLETSRKRVGRRPQYFIRGFQNYSYKKHDPEVLKRNQQIITNSNFGESLNKLLEEINTSIDDVIISWLDKLGFKNIRSEKGFVYKNSEGNFLHYIIFNKPNLIKYIVKNKDNQTIFSDEWNPSDPEETDDLFRDIIGSKFDSFE